ncbi:hypothetical protein A3J90_08420 [candidate division WOR-1 bacterium RIFOXYC2_FULL_37_10]|uniref:Uncharacterized protein n=1 Tax=candidate division WOR-1 bacterium RIFOXYB2_FULL_37_13 TaxID=1802579 RepID=A0A1F4SV18_UNCSA|nr:MAG: hypothetical protein A2246_01500 [candidate division WOR-1 bacterium RIFOXYA2_FULL_37_7]OGC24282.1 MAG: hypothetical protein A2310_08140 [candidate division WOR-1 bacterium RIFOXYB2_FULL_37_13]OGC36389.1 MAG: hypothetical protein A3J90_08420 [candidate division WOR-1 bacterium RIFOXYC2_FULL_37_10]
METIEELQTKAEFCNLPETLQGKLLGDLLRANLNPKEFIMSLSGLQFTQLEWQQIIKCATKQTTWQERLAEKLKEAEKC